MDNTKVIAIYGSPRPGGNTELLLDKLLKGAESEGATVNRIHVRDYCIAPCRECLACYHNGQCVIEDDMRQMYPRLLAADIVVLASPIFFYGVTAGAKALIDRVQALWARRYVLKDPSLDEPGKKRQGYFISVGGTKGPKMFEGAVLTVKYFFDAFNVSYEGELLVRGVDAKGDILKQPAVMDEAWALGRRLVRDRKTSS